MKTSPKFYRGIEYICLDELPANQRMLLQASPTVPERINIMINNEVVSNCVQYKEYCLWFDQVYKKSVSAQGPSTTETPLVKLAVNNI